MEKEKREKEPLYFSGQWTDWEIRWTSKGWLVTLKMILKNIPTWSLHYHMLQRKYMKTIQTWQVNFTEHPHSAITWNAKWIFEEIQMEKLHRLRNDVAKWNTRQWDLALCLPCFLSWCQICDLQQRQENEGVGPLPQEELYILSMTQLEGGISEYRKTIIGEASV